MELRLALSHPFPSAIILQGTKAFDIAQRVVDTQPGRGGFPPLPNLFGPSLGDGAGGGMLGRYGIPFQEDIFGLRGQKVRLQKEPLKEKRQTHVQEIFGPKNNPWAR